MSRTGVYETQLGMDAALAAIEDTAWAEKARFTIAAYCAAGLPFTSDDIRHTMTDAPPNPNAIGALFKKIADEGWIVMVGTVKSTRPEAHGRRIIQWRSAS